MAIRTSTSVRRVPRLLGALASAAIVCALAGCGGGSGAAIDEPGADVGTPLSRPVPPAVLRLPLTTDTGATTSLGAFRGKTILLTDFMTLCADACPLVSQELDDIDHVLATAHMQDKVQLVELTVDPARDTPAQLAAYRKLFDAPANWSMLTASPATIARIWSTFGVYYHRTKSDPGATNWLTGKPLTYDVAHSDDAMFISPTGVWRFLIGGLPDVKGQQLPAALRGYLSDQGEQMMDHPAVDAWTTQQAISVLSWMTGTKIGG